MTAPTWHSLWRIGRVGGALLLMLVAAGCGGDDEADPDGTAEEEFEGLSPQELQQNVEPMTLEQAESLGIVDTTITAGSPIGPDSLPILNGAQPQTQQPAIP